jgi:hypothetical protein
MATIEPASGGMAKYDGEAVFDSDTGEVDSAASAKENWGAAGESLKNMFRSNHKFDTGNFFSDLVLTLIGWPLLLVAEGVDIVAGPFLATKDAADAAMHGLAAGFKKIF